MADPPIPTQLPAVPMAAPAEHLSGKQDKPTGTLTRRRTRLLTGLGGSHTSTIARIIGHTATLGGTQRSASSKLTVKRSLRPPLSGMLYRRPLVWMQPANDRPRGWGIRWLPECEGLTHPKLGPKGGICAVDNKAILTEEEERFARPHVEERPV